MERTLVLMRHAKSSWVGNTPDELRELSERGRRDARAAGEELQRRGMEPLVLVSPARRTQATWAAMTEAGATSSEVRETPELYRQSPGSVVTTLKALPDEVTTVLCLGHEPSITALVQSLGEREATRPWYALDEKFPTATMAFLTVPGSWADLGDELATLTELVVPRGQADRQLSDRTRRATR